MAFSYYNYTGDGATTQFPVAFPYIRREHVLAAVAGSPATFTFVNSSTIQMDAAPANGAVVRVYRQTPLTAPLVDFTDGATLVAADLDTNAKQSIYTQQELSDSQEEGLANVIPDGDKGDIATSVGGTIWTIDTGAVTTAKLASVIAPTVSSVNGGPLAGFRNAIINGNFDISQRGGSFTASGYGIDRWIHGASGTTQSVTQQAFTVGQTDVPNEPQWFCRTVVTSVAGVGNYALLGQRIENVRTFAGQQVTVSFWAKVDATKNISVEMSQSFGTGGSPSAVVNSIGVTKVSIGTSWQKVTVTATIPSISGKTLGSSPDSYLDLAIWFDAGSTFNTRTATLGQQSGTFDIAQVQIERGPVATPFERRPQQTELALCQRYYEPVVNYWVGQIVATAVYSSYSFYNVEKRASPTATSIGQSGAGNGGFGARTAGGLTTRGFLAAATAASTVNGGGWSDSWAISAEL